MEKDSTVNLNELFVQNPMIWLRNIVIKLPNPEISVVAIYTSVASLIIFFVLIFFYNGILNYEKNRIESLVNFTFIIEFLIALILKIISSYFFYFIMTEFKSSYYHLYIYPLIRAIPLLIFIIYYFSIFICLYKSNICTYAIKKYNSLLFTIYLPFVIELGSNIILFVSLGFNIKSETEILILLIGTYIEIVNIILILLLPKIIFGYFDTENELFISLLIRAQV